MDFGLKNLQLKVRTPCAKKDGNEQEMCNPSERYVLDTFNGDEKLRCEGDAKQTFCGDVIMLWQIVGESKKGDKTYILNPNGKITKGRYDKDINTEIHEYLLNEAKKGNLNIGTWSCSTQYCVLNEVRNGIELDSDKKSSIINFLKNNEINKPILKLTIIHSLNAYPSGAGIPYLEYQININSGNIPPADVNQIVIAEGFSGNYKQTIQGNVPQKSSVIDYVVQQ